MDRTITVSNSLTWPNAITIGRLFLGLVGIYVAWQSEWFISGLCVYFVFGMLPDALDGYIARKYGQKSRLGELLDPFADKVLFYVAIFALFSHFVWWTVFIPLAICDIISTIVHILKSGGAVWAGKWKFILQNGALILLVLAAFMNRKIIEVVSLSMEIALFANIVLVAALLCATYSLYHRIKAN